MAIAFNALKQFFEKNFQRITTPLKSLSKTQVALIGTASLLLIAYSFTRFRQSCSLMTRRISKSKNESWGVYLWNRVWGSSKSQSSQLEETYIKPLPEGLSSEYYFRIADDDAKSEDERKVAISKLLEKYVKQEDIATGYVLDLLKKPDLSQCYLDLIFPKILSNVMPSTSSNFKRYIKALTIGVYDDKNEEKRVDILFNVVSQIRDGKLGLEYLSCVLDALPNLFENKVIENHKDKFITCYLSILDKTQDSDLRLKLVEQLVFYCQKVTQDAEAEKPVEKLIECIESSSFDKACKDEALSAFSLPRVKIGISKAKRIEALHKLLEKPLNLLWKYNVENVLINIDESRNRFNLRLIFNQILFDKYITSSDKKGVFQKLLVTYDSDLTTDAELESILTYICSTSFPEEEDWENLVSSSFHNFFGLFHGIEKIQKRIPILKKLLGDGLNDKFKNLTIDIFLTIFDSSECQAAFESSPEYKIIFEDVFKQYQDAEDLSGVMRDRIKEKLKCFTE